MAQEKGKNIVTEPPMNPQPRLFPIPFGKLHGCDGDGCGSERDTWPLYHVLRRGVHCRLCSSCILLSHRSLYCCRCFLLVTSPSHYDDGDPLMALPAPTVTCPVCREAVVHLPCLYYPEPPADDYVFVCPPCTAAQNERPFSYAPPCGKTQLDERDKNVLVLASRMALALLKRHAIAARASAERLAREAQEARKRAQDALKLANDLAKKEDPSWVVPQSPENDLAASEEEGNEGEANVGKVLLVRRNEMPSLATLTIGTGGSVVPMALAEAKHAPSSSQSKPLCDSVENDLNDNAAENEAEAVQAEPNMKGKGKEVALNSSNMKEVAMAAAEAARTIPPTPQTLQLFPSSKTIPTTLQLFPSSKASSSTKMPHTKKPRTKRPRTLQLFKDDRA